MLSAQLTVKWDPKNLEIRTRSVERTLEPLVIQVTTLVNTKGPSNKKKGRSKRALQLVSDVEAATDKFVERGTQIANENNDIKQELLHAVENVKKSGASLSVKAKDFATDPCSIVKRQYMVNAARDLLSSVTRLLILADSVDIHILLKSTHVVRGYLEKLKLASSDAEVQDAFQHFGRSAGELFKHASKRQPELKDQKQREELAAARAVLKKHSIMLLTASKAYVRHPEISAAKANRDYVYKQVEDAIDSIAAITEGKVTTASKQPAIGPGIGTLAAAMDDFELKMVVDPLQYSDLRTRPLLEESLESIVSGAALVADSSGTRDDRRDRIIAECNNVRAALQDLLSEYMANAGKREVSDSLDEAMVHMNDKTRGLRRQLRKAAVDHVSDTYTAVDYPLLVLYEAAKAGDLASVENCADVFAEHSRKLVEVGNLSCSLSSDAEGVQMVRHAAARIENLCPQVIYAARVLAARPKSKVALDSMNTFKKAWQDTLLLLTEAVDDITTIDDFLAVSESHILEDFNRCVHALQEKDADDLSRTAGAIGGRAMRICNVVTSEMDKYEAGVYTERVLEAVRVMREQVMPGFVESKDITVDALSSSPPKNFDDNEFIDASRLVYDSVREIRSAVLMNRTEEELDPDEVIIDQAMDARSRTSTMTGLGTGTDIDEYPEISRIKYARDAMQFIAPSDKKAIAAHVEMFRSEKSKFDNEVAKWDDSGNDVIVLAKAMCSLMMEMTAFTQGKGRLKTAMDVINTAKLLSDKGAKMDSLVKQLSNMYPDSQKKSDLLAYLEQIILYCHQLNITSKVKAEVQIQSGEVVVSGLEGVTSLIQTSTNLINAVVNTVKAASIVYQRSRSSIINSPIVVWKMKAPEKKPLILQSRPTESPKLRRTVSARRNAAAMKELNKFRSPNQTK